MNDGLSGAHLANCRARGHCRATGLPAVRVGPLCLLQARQLATLPEASIQEIGRAACSGETAVIGSSAEVPA